MGAFSGDLAHNALALATLLNQAEFLNRAVVVTLVGAPDDPDTVALWRAVMAASLPDRVMVTLAPGAVVPADHPGHGKSMVGGRPTAYICIGQTCGPPHTDAGGLSAALSARPS